MTIWKFELQEVSHQEITMPLGAQILCVQVQHDKPCLWVLADPCALPAEERAIEIRGTGQSLTGAGGRYIGTYQLSDEQCVGHVFEVNR